MNVGAPALKGDKGVSVSVLCLDLLPGYQGRLSLEQFVKPYTFDICNFGVCILYFTKNGLK